MDLFFRKVGSGRPMVIVHGLFGSGDNWMSLANKMKGFEVYLPDLRNHGQSPWDPSFRVPDLAADLFHFLKTNRINDALLVGHSLGGRAIMELALSHPEEIAGIAVVDMAPREYEPQYDGFVQAMKAVDLERVQTRQDAQFQLSSVVTDKPTMQFLLKSLVPDSDGRWKWRLNLDALADHYEEIWKPLVKNRAFMGSSLFLSGSESDYVQKHDESLIRELFPNAVLSIVQGAGHWLHAEKPGEVLQTLRDWAIRSLKLPTLEPWGLA